MTARLVARLERVAAERRAALVTYVMGGDPDLETSSAILAALPAAGADIVELGMPFTDPIADGPAIQAAGGRALEAGQTLRATLKMASKFRAADPDTPLILMGYYNPIYVYGVELFLSDAKRAGVDGLIIVDCPPEEDDEICLPARQAGLAFVRLVAPTTEEAASAGDSWQRRRVRVLCLDHRRHRIRRAECQTGGRGRGATKTAHPPPRGGWVWREKRAKAHLRLPKPLTAWRLVRPLLRGSDDR